MNEHFPLIYTNRYDYKRVVANMFSPEDCWENVFPTIVPNWDRTPRIGKKAIVYTNSTPAAFEQHVKNALQVIKDKQPEHQILFLKSWNEWAEGNYVEPDLQYGRGYLDAIHNALHSELA